jgi:hypothetical protein
MMIFSAYSKKSRFLAAVNDELIESEWIGNCSIKKTLHNKLVLIVRHEIQNMGACFLPCYTFEQAIALAAKGIPVLDIDRMMESMNDDNWGDPTTDTDANTDDVVIANEIIDRVNKYVTGCTMMKLLPTKNFTLR